MVQTRLAGHRLLFSGEVDCRDKDPSAPAPPACYVELKTSAEICTPKQRSNLHRWVMNPGLLSVGYLMCNMLLYFTFPSLWFHRFKLLKWWAQSFLPGVPRVVAGFRDHDGVVVSVETFHISKISHLIKV